MTREAAEQASMKTKLRANLDKCKGLSERLELAEKWEFRLTEILQETGGEVGELESF